MVILVVATGVALRVDNVGLRVGVSKVLLLADPDLSGLHLTTFTLPFLVEVQLWPIERVRLLLVCSQSSCLLGLALHL